MKRQSIQEMSYVHSGLLTAYPRYLDLFPKIVEILLSHNGIYVPEYVEIATPTKSDLVPFSPGIVNQLSNDWRRAPEASICDMKRHSPVEVEVTLANAPWNPFEGPGVDVERSYFQSSREVNELLNVLVDLYSVFQPAYAFIRTTEMGRGYNNKGKEKSRGINLQRGLPDIYWANFLGPEYVEMFGQEALKSAPFHKVEKLSDGGALMILSPSLFDIESDPEGFERLRIEAKRHLGMDAFDTGDRSFRGKTPRFRFLDERAKTMTPIKLISVMQSDLLSAVPRHEWSRWLRDVQSLGLDLVRETGSQGIKLDYSSESLARLDTYVADQHFMSSPKIEILMKVSAYVSEVITRSSKAKWSFTDSQEIPVLVLGNIQLSPLARAQKVFLEGEKFEPWYRYFTEEQTAKEEPSKSN